ncbi:hypothetical protein ACFWRG_19960 [Micromonospora tulbaghiae]|uniref:hypothetical protein n=1 Tax=Micromonospora tulbaghiae TaxID=479978 RepID=UPI00365FB993
MGIYGDAAATDTLAAAARAELNAIEAQLRVDWDLEMGLKQILVTDHYDRFERELATSFDVEAGLSHVLERSAPVTEARFAQQIGHWAQSRQAIRELNTIEQVRRLSCYIIEVVTAVIDELSRPIIIGLEAELERAEDAGSQLGKLAQALERREASREESVRGLREVVEACIELYNAVLDLEPESTDSDPVAQLPTLAVRAGNLQRPVARLFDLSDDAVDALL